MESEEKSLQEFELTAQEKQTLQKMAAVGVDAKGIAAVLELKAGRLMQFLFLASMPGSLIAELIESGRVAGQALPQIMLQEQASAGNVAAINSLQHIQLKNRFNELLNEIDNDEFAGQAFQD